MKGMSGSNNTNTNSNNDYKSGPNSRNTGFNFASGESSAAQARNKNSNIDQGGTTAAQTWNANDEKSNNINNDENQNKNGIKNNNRSKYRPVASGGQRQRSGHTNIHSIHSNSGSNQNQKRNANANNPGQNERYSYHSDDRHHGTKSHSQSHSHSHSQSSKLHKNHKQNNNNNNRSNKKNLVRKNLNFKVKSEYGVPNYGVSNNLQSFSQSSSPQPNPPVMDNPAFNPSYVAGLRKRNDSGGKHLSPPKQQVVKIKNENEIEHHRDEKRDQAQIAESKYTQHKPKLKKKSKVKRGQSGQANIQLPMTKEQFDAEKECIRNEYEKIAVAENNWKRWLAGCKKQYKEQMEAISKIKEKVDARDFRLSNCASHEYLVQSNLNRPNHQRTNSVQSDSISRVISDSDTADSYYRRDATDESPSQMSARPPSQHSDRSMSFVKVPSGGVSHSRNSSNNDFSPVSGLFAAPPPIDSDNGGMNHSGYGSHSGVAYGSHSGVAYGSHSHSNAGAADGAVVGPGSTSNNTNSRGFFGGGATLASSISSLSAGFVGTNKNKENVIQSNRANEIAAIDTANSNDVNSFM